MKPLKVFIGNINYKSEFRTFLVDLLKPIIPEVNLIKYQLTIPPVELIQNYSESECILKSQYDSLNYSIKMVNSNFDCDPTLLTNDSDPCIDQETQIILVLFNL